MSEFMSAVGAWFSRHQVLITAIGAAFNAVNVVIQYFLHEPTNMLISVASLAICQYVLIDIYRRRWRMAEVRSEAWRAVLDEQWVHDE